MEAHLGVESAKAARALRNLEAVYLVSRTSYAGGKWRYRATNIAKTDREKALDHVVTKFLNCFAPATVEEVSFALGLEEEEARRTLRALVEEEVADEGRFVISEHVQYMLKRDRLRLRSSGANVYDSRTVDSYRRSKQNGPFASIEECVRFFGQVGMPVDVQRRVPSFSLEEWTRLRRGGRLLSGPFRPGQGALCAGGGRSDVRRRLPQHAPDVPGRTGALHLAGDGGNEPAPVGRPHRHGQGGGEGIPGPVGPQSLRHPAPRGGRGLVPGELLHPL